MFSFADTLVLILYFAGTLVVGVWAGRVEKNTDDYFLGGRRQPWIIAGLSLLATEISALTFIGVPGGAFAKNWEYLQLFVGSFVGRMAIVWVLLPSFYRARVTTVYEFLGQRFGPWTRGTASMLFFASRTIGSGLRLLAAALALHVVFDWELNWVIAGSAAFAVFYTTLGGIKSIMWTEALQVAVFIGGPILAIVFALSSTPAPMSEDLRLAVEAGKLHVFNIQSGWNNERSFVVLLIHTLFLNAAVFGTDQDLTQRLLTCSDLRGGQKSLTFNAVIGLPVVVLFLTVGAAMWVYYQGASDGAAVSDMAPDRTFPYFIAHALPSGWGLRGLLVAGVFAVAMSSTASALGALSSIAVVDVYRPYFARNKPESHYVNAGRVFVVGFGVALVAIAILFSKETELLWAAFEWASLIFGSLLGVFLLGVLTQRRGRDRVNMLAMLSAVAILCGIKFAQSNLEISIPWPLSMVTGIVWPWWIVIGTVWTFVVGALFRPTVVTQSRR